MKVFHSKKELNQELSLIKDDGGSIGFVPTMGALHKGHISLVDESKKVTSTTVASIFVNPTQFNDKGDLDNYPRNLKMDLEKLEAAGCNIVFVPSEREMYPETDKRVFDFGDLATVMEGAHRPGHFNGVGQVVSKLFDIVQPHKAFFGQKDFQQVAIIRKLTEIMNTPVEVIACPIMREPHGLAMSSRNERLTKEQRENAAHIFKTLTEFSNKPADLDVESLKKNVIKKINQNEYLEVEYFDIVDKDSLMSVKNWKESENIYGCIAVFCGQVRLIDNIKFNL